MPSVIPAQSLKQVEQFSPESQVPFPQNGTGAVQDEASTKHSLEEPTGKQLKSPFGFESLVASEQVSLLSTNIGTSSTKSHSSPWLVSIVPLPQGLVGTIDS